MSFIANSPLVVGGAPTTTIRRSRVLTGALPAVASSQYVTGGLTTGGLTGAVTYGAPVASYGTTSTRVVTDQIGGGIVGGSYGTGLVGSTYGTGLVGGSYGTGLVGSTTIGGAGTVIGGTYGTGLATSGLVSPAPIYNKAVVEEIPTESRIEYVPYEKREIIYEQVERVEQIPVQRVITEYEEVVRTQTVPVQRVVQDYYAVEYQVEYIPNVVQ